MPRGAVTDFADRAVAEIAERDPCLAALLGVPSAGLTDFGPAASQQRVEHLARLHAEAEQLAVNNDVDRSGRDVIVERLGAMAAIGEAGEYLRDLNTMASPPQQIRGTVELMVQGGDSAEVADVVTAIPDALSSWRESLEHGAAAGLVAARRQTVAVAEQLSEYASSWLPAEVKNVGGGAALESAVDSAAEAFRTTAMWLADIYVGWARTADGVGEDDYLRYARLFTGMEVDLDETMQWGLVEMDRISGLLREATAELDPNLRPDQLPDLMQREPRYHLDGEAVLLDYLRQQVSRTCDRVDGVLFDVDPRLAELNIELVTDSAGLSAYYVPPSEDLSRPGSTFFPTGGANTFPRWQLDVLCLHEAVPGHHLQLGGAAVSTSLNRFSKAFGSTSGYAEGWAMYAERLGQEQGWFDDVISRLGYLSMQMLRAVRLFVDIGLHTERPIPAGFPGAGSMMTAELARELLQRQALMSKEAASVEVDRYLGLPGQAISYKLGEREWLQARERARERSSDEFNLRKWHSDVLAMGPMGLAQFRRETAAMIR